MVAGMSCSVWPGKTDPIDVVKIPMAAPLKQAFDENVDRIRRERLPKELASALKQQLRIAIKR